MYTREWENILKEKMSAYNIYEPSEDAIQFVRELLEKRTKEVIHNMTVVPTTYEPVDDAERSYATAVKDIRGFQEEQAERILKHFGIEK